eukprot:scaffold1218_cov393-Prasinococcus_capsulatus_cf.AAC.7
MYEGRGLPSSWCSCWAPGRSLERVRRNARTRTEREEHKEREREGGARPVAPRRGSAPRATSVLLAIAGANPTLDLDFRVRGGGRVTLGGNPRVRVGPPSRGLVLRSVGSEGGRTAGRAWWSRRASRDRDRQGRSS